MDVQHTDWLNCITGKQWSLYLVSANNGLSTSFTGSVYVLQDEILTPGHSFIPHRHRSDP